FGAFRGQAPLALLVTLNWTDPSLLEGRLQLKWYVDRTHLGTYLTPETALAESSIIRSILLPPVIMPRDEAVFSVQGAFLTADRVYDLDIHDVAVPLDWRRTFLVALCREPPLRMDVDGPASATTSRTRLIESLRLEEFFSERFPARELSTLVLEIEPDDLPDTPLRLLTFDMLVVPGDRFTSLSDEHWKSIAIWVEAGGSLCCLINSPLQQEHVAFLNRLAGGDPAEAPYLRTDEGRLLPVTGDPAGIDLYRPGLGRLAVALGPVDYDSREWERALLFLWKVRHDRISRWEKDRAWPQAPPMDQFGYQSPLTLEPQRHLAADHITELLLPESVQGLPLVTVSALLVLFLMAIAPGDYYLLGRLRLRRCTWVLFPALSLLFTWIMMTLAARHLGTSNLGRSLTIVDLAPNGRPVRTSRLDLLYPASNRIDRAEQNSSLMVPVDPGTEETGAARDGTPMPPRYEPPWTYVGSVPGRHVVERTVRQWSPRLSRTTTIGPPERPVESPLAEFDWASVSRKQLADAAGFLELQRALQRHDPSVNAVVLNNASPQDTGPPGDQRANVFSFLQAISFTGDSMLFSHVSQISPTAAGQWEDLALNDQTDGETLLLLVMTESSEGQYVAYRKLFPKDP
ncbi:MAG: hypothetical protein AB7U20_17660, partial [Planctomycetaceae bacterium]